MDWLVQEYRAGRHKPEPIALPAADLDDPSQVVADFFAVVAALRDPVDYLPRSVLFSCEWVSKYTGIPKMTVWRALRRLEEKGVLKKVGTVPSGKGHRTDTYLPGGAA